MSNAALIYPHQLFADHPALRSKRRAILIEEPLFFSQYRFHRQKLMLHRVTMQRYAEQLRHRHFQVDYVAAHDLTETAAIGAILQKWEIRSVSYVDPSDDWLSTRLANGLREQGIKAQVLNDPHFLTPRSIIDQFAAGKKRLFFTEFYIEQRRRLGLLLEADGKPVGGQWSFDPANRKKLPRSIRVPGIQRPAVEASVEAARDHVRKKFPAALGSDEDFGYPADHAAAAKWLDDFLRERFALFGDYEDAISSVHDVLFHSQLTPMLNIGLLSPQQVVDAALKHAHAVPLNSQEGFLRQVIGWREFVRLVYLTRGRKQRTRNFWGFCRSLPKAFYDGTTGVEPVDHVIRQVLRCGYCHHIERLMILGNFMLLCEIEPDAVYQWFMELFIDAYDWVMVPNVYGMSQHADGGLMTTKPYISGSSYILKMSDFARGPWCEIWDALYWRFIDRHSDFFAANNRMAMIVKLKDKLGAKLKQHNKTAEAFLDRLHGSV